LGKPRDYSLAHLLLNYQNPHLSQSLYIWSPTARIGPHYGGARLVLSGPVAAGGCGGGGLLSPETVSRLRQYLTGVMP